MKEWRASLSTFVWNQFVVRAMMYGALGRKGNQAHGSEKFRHQTAKAKLCMKLL